MTRLRRIGRAATAAALDGLFLILAWPILAGVAIAMLATRPRPFNREDTNR